MEALLEDPGFNIGNPNKVYALLGTFFRGNPGEFHRVDGRGYVLWAEQLLILNGRNPQVAARMARSLENWRRYTPEIQARIEPVLRQVLEDEALSSDVREIIEKALQE